MPHQPVDPAERLANWEAEHGFPGVLQGRSLYRRCECGRPTACLADAQCRACKGIVRINQRFQCRKDACSGSARKSWGMLCRPCWIAEDPERAARVLAEWEEEKGFAGVFCRDEIKRKCACGKAVPTLDRATCCVCTTREAKIASGFRPKHTPVTNRIRKRCTTDGCEKVAHHAMGTQCEACYVRADPDARGCPRCKKNKQVKSRADGLCCDCVRSARRRAEGRRRKTQVSRDALVDAVSAADLEDALGGHLGECLVVD